MNMPDLSNDAIVSAATDQVSGDMGGQVLILRLSDGGYFSLEGVAVRVWELLSEPRSVGEIEKTLLAEYEVPAEQCRRDLDQLLRDLAERGLVQIRQ